MNASQTHRTPSDPLLVRRSIEERLEGLLPPSSTPLYAAARYSLLSQGKRLRPCLAIASGETFGASLAESVDPACAVEMIHTYSLIHDDLPCMDDDDLRRGRPTLHKVFPEGLALLTGDYLLTFAFEVLGHAPLLSSDQKLHLIQILSEAAGDKGMIGGQAEDITAAGKRIDEAALIKMHQGKTGALIAASLQFGAVIGKAPPEMISHLKTVGLEIGLAFQFLDDLLDATSNKESLGKNVNRDAALRKPTAAAFYGIEGVKERLIQFHSSLEKELTALPEGGIAIKDLLHRNLWSRIPKI